MSSSRVHCGCSGRPSGKKSLPARAWTRASHLSKSNFFSIGSSRTPSPTLRTRTSLPGSRNSFGVLVSALVSPVVGRLMDRYGPRLVIEGGVLICTAGLLSATLISTPWQLYATLGLLVGIGANSMTYSVHSQFLPNWFVRRRALAIGIAFSGVGVRSMALLPWRQSVIVHVGC